MTTRKIWVDIAKGIGILLVVLAHTRFPSQGMTWWINSFHMPLFFILAGLCYDENRYPRLIDYLKRKAVALVYPYFTLSLMVIGLMSLLYWGNDPNWSASQLVKNMLHGAPGGAFWFITVLLEVELGYAVLARLLTNRYARLAVSFAVSIACAYAPKGTCPYFIDVTGQAIFFYAMGHFVRAEWNRRLSGFSRLSVIGFGAGSLVVHIILLLTVYQHKAGFAARDLHMPVLYFVLALLGTMTVVSFSVLMERVTSALIKPASKALVFLGRNTIIILAFHNFLGLCRHTWPFGGLLSQLLEFAILGALLYLLSGPLHFLIVPRKQLRRGCSLPPIPPQSAESAQSAVPS